MSTGSARAVSINSPKAFFASRAHMIFMEDLVAIQCAINGRMALFAKLFRIRP